MVKYYLCNEETTGGYLLDISINGLNTHYTQEGAGDNILLLHGWGCNVKTLQSISNLLKTKYKVTALDLPGFGKTAEPKSPFGVNEYASFVLSFLNILDISKTIMVGHSLGGQIITYIATKTKHEATNKIEIPKIILIGSAGARPKKSFKTRLKIRLFKIKRFTLNLPVIRFIFAKSLEKLKANAGSEDYRNASELMRKCLVKVVNEDLTPLFHLNTIETLLIWGENDTATPLSSAKTMETLMPNAGLAVVQNAGHYPFLDQPAVFNSILKNYLF